MVQAKYIFLYIRQITVDTQVDTQVGTQVDTQAHMFPKQLHHMTLTKIIVIQAVATNTKTDMETKIVPAVSVLANALPVMEKVGMIIHSDQDIWIALIVHTANQGYAVNV